MQYNVGDIIYTKKKHPCGDNKWEVVRAGADYKIKCCKCSRFVMLTLDDLKKITKKIEKA
ncbi:MAG: DUF951 domain-containing protein [Clostridia bacterium]|nr:DUF951 domain-containing protein [Clostridia bacterium]